MPPVIAAVPAAFAAFSAFTATTIIGSITVGSILTSVALSGASYLAQKLLAPKAQSGASSAVSEISKQTVKQGLPTARIIYGRALVGGALFFIERRGDWLYYGMALNNGEIDSIEEIRIGNRRVSFDALGAANSSPYVGYVFRSIRNGTDDQLIDPILDVDFTELPDSFRQRGVASIVLKFYQPIGIADALNVELYGQSRQPTPLLLIKGSKVFDPRDTTQLLADKATWKWSKTPSLCAAHFQTLPAVDGGGGTSWAQIDLGELIEAANADESPVGLKAGGSQKRYTCNGVVALDGTAPDTVVQSLLTANMGQRITSGNIYKFRSGVPREMVWTIDENSCRGDFSFRNGVPRRDKINAVSASFASTEREYQVQETTAIRNLSYISIDDIDLPGAVDLPFTNNAPTAQRIAKILMEKSRVPKTVSRKEDLCAMFFDAGDVINLESEIFPMATGLYEIQEVGQTDNALEYEVTLTGYDPRIYDWNPAVDERDFTLSPAVLN